MHCVTYKGHQLYKGNDLLQGASFLQGALWLSRPTRLHFWPAASICTVKVTSNFITWPAYCSTISDKNNWALFLIGCVSAVVAIFDMQERQLHSAYCYCLYFNYCRSAQLRKKKLLQERRPRALYDHKSTGLLFEYGTHFQWLYGKLLVLRHSSLSWRHTVLTIIGSIIRVSAPHGITSVLNT